MGLTGFFSMEELAAHVAGLRETLAGVTGSGKTSEGRREHLRGSLARAESLLAREEAAVVAAEREYEGAQERAYFEAGLI